LLEIKTWGIEWKGVIDKTYEWVACQWANAKINKESLALLKQIIHILKENMEDYNLVMFTHAMDFFKEHTSLKKPVLEHFFTSFLKRFVNKRFGNAWQLAFNRVHEAPKMIVCNSRIANLGAT